LAAAVLERVWGRKASFAAVDGVSLAFAAGETVGVVGESGSGKSTLAEVLGDLQRPTAGTVLYKGRDIRSLDKTGYRVFRRNVQFVFQSPKESLKPYFTIEKALMEPIRFHGHVDIPLAADIVESLARVGLPATCASNIRRS
jgi:ABC-type glutathione transport system ATPase component